MKLYSILILFLIVFSCGNDGVANNNRNLRNNEPMTQDLAETLYNSLIGPERVVEISDMVGTSIFQRSEDNKFCRKVGSVVPNPAFTFQCWQVLNTGAEAQTTYQSLDGREYGINIGNVVGTGTKEKLNRNETTLCQVVTGVHPGAVGTFTCYKRL